MTTVKHLFISLLVLFGYTSGAWAIEQDSDGYYLIGSVQDWQNFAAIVETTPTANAKMIADVDLGDDQTMIGTSSMKYQGTFDGQAHTLTVNYFGSSKQFIAPLHYVDGGTILNLRIDGIVSSSSEHLSGLIGKAYNEITIENCLVAAEIKMNSDYAGGFVGNGGSQMYNDPSKVVFKNCLFAGTFTGVGGSRNTAAGFYGWGKSTPVFINCLENGTYNNVSGYNPYMYEGTDKDNTETTANSYYKHGNINLEGISDASAMTDGEIVSNLGDAWVIDGILNIPMLKIFTDEGGENPAIDPNFISGLVQHWPFDGNANNSISGGVDATVYGATLTTDRFGNENCAYYFDGNDKMIAAGAANFGTTSFTANIWVCSTKTSGLGNLMRTDGGYYKGWLLRFNSGRIEIWEGRSFYTGYVSTTSYADGNWHMLTFVRDVENKVGQLYVDGCYVGGYSMGSPINDVTNELRFGTYGEGEYYTGKMDDARLYDRALSAEEVAALYTQNGAIIYTVPTSGIGTFSAAYNIIIPEELTAYYCTTLKTNKDGSLGIKVSKLEGGVIPANTGVLLEGPASRSYMLTATNEEATAPVGNSLVAVVESEHIAATNGDYTNFMMKGGKFIRIADESEDVKMPANRAYLPLLTADISGSNAKEIMLLWDDKEATGIESLTPSPSPMGEGSIYNLNGQKLSSPLKGINIINGRKVIVK